jgi:hypothetical protein
MFRFTIRDVLWLMVVVGLGVTCIVQRSDLRESSRARYDLQKLVTLLSEQGYRVMWEDELGTMGGLATDPYLPHATEPKHRPDRTDLPHDRLPISH